MTEEIKPTPEEKPAEENIFIANPEPPTPAKSNTIAWEIIVAIVVMIVIIVAAAAWSFSAANTAAAEYQSSVREQLVKIEEYMQPLSPEEVLNNSDIEASVESLSSLKHPVLGSVILGPILSTRYQQAEKLRQDVDEHYAKLDEIAKQLTQFNDAKPEVLKIKSSVKKAQEELSLNDASALRSMSGTLDSASQQVSQLAVPPQLEGIRGQVGGEFELQAKLYQEWAGAVDKGQLEKIPETQAAIEKSNQKIIKLTSDENYAKQFEATYKKIMNNQAALTKRLTY